jgi:hypothetical protein
MHRKIKLSRESGASQDIGCKNHSSEEFFFLFYEKEERPWVFVSKLETWTKNFQLAVVSHACIPSTQEAGR